MRASYGPAVLTDGISLPGIGELVDLTACWGLRYTACEHTQLFARHGLENPSAAARYAMQRFAECLSCRLDQAICNHQN